MAGPLPTRHTLWGHWWGRLLWGWAAQPHCLAFLGELCPEDVEGICRVGLERKMG
jgi:hypothetical protein